MSTPRIRRPPPKQKIGSVRDRPPDPGILLEAYSYGPVQMFMGITTNYHGYFFEVRIPQGGAFMRRHDFANRMEARCAGKQQAKKTYPNLKGYIAFKQTHPPTKETIAT